jgi:hypothetical protein
MMKRLKPNDAVGIGLALSHVDLPYSMNKYFLSPEELPHVFGRRYRNFRDNPDATVSQHPSDRHEFNVSTYSQPKLMKQLGIRYFVVGETPLTLFTTPEFEMKRIRTLYKPVVRFSPLKNERSPHTAEAYDQLDAFYIPFTDPAMIQRPGPTITIYQVR